MNEKMYNLEQNTDAEIDALIISDLGGDVDHIRQAMEVSHDLREVTYDLVDALAKKPDLAALALLTALNSGVEMRVPPVPTVVAKTPNNAQMSPVSAPQAPESDLITYSAKPDSVPNVPDIALNPTRIPVEPTPAYDELAEAKHDHKVFKRDLAREHMDEQNKFFASQGFVEKNPYDSLIDEVFGAVSPELAQEAKEVLRYYDPVTGKVTKENANFDPNAENVNADGSTDYGLFQINGTHTLEDLINRFPDIAVNLDIHSADALLKPETNVKVALWVMWQFQGWRAWYGAPDHLRRKPRYTFTDKQLEIIHEILYE